MSVENSKVGTALQIGSAVIVLTALALAPAPLLPPHFLSEKIQPLVGGRWKVAYLIAGIGLQAFFFFFIGALSVFTVKRANDSGRRLSQLIAVPVAVILIALAVRTIKLGHFPVWINAVVPAAACIVGVWFGLGVLYKRSVLIFLLIVVSGAVTFWAMSGTATPELTQATEKKIQQLITEKYLPTGDARFGFLLQKAFAKSPDSKQSAVEQNRSAILALGIVLGDHRLARFVRIEQRELLRQVMALRQGTTLQQRGDWSQHFTVSAALTVLENPLISDAGGLMKEQMDALTGGSGFSFTDFAADRAGVRFALAATNSEEDAKAMQDFLSAEFQSTNFLPPITDLSENMSTEQFRARYGTTGSAAYRAQVNVIESRLDSCRALSPLRSARKH